MSNDPQILPSLHGLVIITVISNTIELSLVFRASPRHVPAILAASGVAVGLGVRVGRGVRVAA
jgi:hypothetical protein